MAVTCQKKKRKDQNVSGFFSPAPPVSSDGGFIRNAAAPPQKKKTCTTTSTHPLLSCGQQQQQWMARSLPLDKSVSQRPLSFPPFTFLFLFSLFLFPCFSFLLSQQPSLALLLIHTQPVLPQLPCRSNAQEHTVPKEETRAVRLICFFCADSITTKRKESQESGRTHHQPRDHTRPSKSQTNQ